MKYLRFSWFLILCLLPTVPVFAGQLFGGLVDDPPDRAVTHTFTIIATDSTADESGTLYQFQTRFTGEGIPFRIRVLRKMGGNAFMFVGESEEIASVEGFAEYATVITGVQVGDYLGLVTYPDGEVFMCGSYNGISDYYLFEGDHNTGIEDYDYYEDMSTICIRARMNEIPPTATSTPLGSATPTPTPPPGATYTPVPSPTRITYGTDLILSANYFIPGDFFSLHAYLWNPGERVKVELWVVLDVYGDYFFWPHWTQEVDFKRIDMWSGLRDFEILEFEWPQGAGSADGIKLWGACLEPETTNLVGDFDMEVFGFGL